jgi:hypothetical protein
MARKLYDPETVKSILQNCNDPAEREQKAAELREKANRWPPGLSRAGHIYVKTYTLEDSCLIVYSGRLSLSLLFVPSASIFWHIVV